MRRIVLFSTPTPNNIKTILLKVFPNGIKNKIFAYMPSDGANIPQEYIDEWRKYSKEHNAEFRLIDNSKQESSEEIKKLLGSNVLVITGGNTFTLLDNLRESGLDKAIKEFSKKDEFVLAGFSAGAIVLAPTIEVCSLPNYDENFVGITDLTGLNIINFEVFPHYDKVKQKKLLEEYRKTAKNKVKEITDDGYLTIDL